MFEIPISLLMETTIASAIACERVETRFNLLSFRPLNGTI